MSYAPPQPIPPSMPPPQQQYPNIYPTIQNGHSSPEAPHPCAPAPPLYSQGTPIHKADTSHTQVYSSFLTNLNLVGAPFSGKFKSPRADLYSRTSSSSTPSRGFSGTQSLEKIREELVRDGRLFEDPEFPADEQSLFRSGRSVKKLVWKRPFVCISLCFPAPQLSLSLSAAFRSHTGLFLVETCALNSKASLFNEFVSFDYRAVICSQYRSAASESVERKCTRGASCVAGGSRFTRTVEMFSIFPSNRIRFSATLTMSTRLA